MLFTLLIAAALAPLARAQDRTLSIGPATLTFSEIASALSVGGRDVLCSAALRNRGAMVSLHGRSWLDACAVLGKGLDVRIRPQPGLPNTWVIEPDPEVTVREQEMRRRLADVLRQAIVEQAKPYQATLREPIHLLVARTMQIEQARDEAEQADPEHKLPSTQRIVAEAEAAGTVGNPFAQVAARLARMARVRSYEAAVASPQPFQGFDIQHMVDVAAVCRLMLADMERQEAQRPPGEGVFGEVDAEIRAIVQRVASGRISAAQRIQFNPADLRVTVQQLYLLGDAFPFRHGISADAVGEGGVDSLLSQLEAVGESADRRDVADRRDSLTAAKQRILVPSEVRVTSLSQVVELWARQTGGEAVMELAPLRELLPEVASPDSDTAGGSPPAEYEFTLKDILARERMPAWSVGAVDGVMLVRNRLAFLDRTRRCALPAMIALERRGKARRSGDGAERRFSLSELARFHAGCTVDENAELSLTPVYRGIDTANLTSGRFATGLARLRNRELAVVGRELAERNRADIPVSALPPREVQAILTAMRAASLLSERGDCEEVWLPDFSRRLAAGSFTLERLDGAVTVELHISAADGSPGGSIRSVTLAWFR